MCESDANFDADIGCGLLLSRVYASYDQPQTTSGVATMSASASDIPKLFLQAIISRNSISDKLAKVLCRKSIEAVKSTQIREQRDHHA
jgi:hypothetical protein